MEIENLTIEKIHKGLIEKEFSALEIAELFIKRIQERESNINAFISTSFDLAREQARKVDEMIAQGKEIIKHKKK